MHVCVVCGVCGVCMCVKDLGPGDDACCCANMRCVLVLINMFCVWCDRLL